MSNSQTARANALDRLGLITNHTFQSIQKLRRAYALELDEIKEDGNQATDLISYYGSIRKAMELMEIEIANVQGMIDHVKYKALPETFDRDGIKTLTSTRGDRVTITVDTLASILQEDRPTAYKWLRENNHGDIIVDYIFPGTLSSFAKTYLEDTGKDFPDVGIKVETRARANFTAGKDSPFRSIKRMGGPKE